MTIKSSLVILLSIITNFQIQAQDDGITLISKLMNYTEYQIDPTISCLNSKLLLLSSSQNSEKVEQELIENALSLYKVTKEGRIITENLIEFIENQIPSVLDNTSENYKIWRMDDLFEIRMYYDSMESIALNILDICKDVANKNEINYIQDNLLELNYLKEKVKKKKMALIYIENNIYILVGIEQER